MVWGAFTGFEKSPSVIIPPTERSAIDFVQLAYEGTLRGFYFMHDQPDQLTRMVLQYIVVGTLTIGDKPMESKR
jgi:hypothetical protein